MLRGYCHSDTVNNCLLLLIQFPFGGLSYISFLRSGPFKTQRCVVFRYARHLTSQKKTEIQNGVPKH